MNKRPYILIFILLSIITFLHYYLLSTKTIFHEFFRLLYYFPIIYGAFKYRLKGGIGISIIVVFLYAPHLLSYFGRFDLQVIYQLLELLMFVITGAITGYLVEKDFKKHQAMERQVIKITNLENLNHNILDSLDSAVIAFDERGQILFLNGVAKNEYWDFIKQHTFNDETKKIFSGDTKTNTTEIQYNQEFYQVSSYSLRNINQNVEGVIFIIKRITLVKSLEEQVQRGQRLAAVGNLAAGVAHEIRNPLGIIKTISQTLNQEENMDEDIKEGLEIIDHEINRANEVVKWLLDFAKADNQIFEPFNLSKTMEQLVKIISKYSEKNK